MHRVLAITNIYPSPEAPHVGTFVEQQVEGLRRLGNEVDVLFVDRPSQGRRTYWRFWRELQMRVAAASPDIVHVMYGGVLAAIVTHRVRSVPAVVSFCGTDLLGQNLSGRTRRLVSKFGVRASWSAARRAHGVVVKSPNLRDALPAAVNREKVDIVPNGVDLELFCPLDRTECRAALGWKADALHVLFPTNNGDPCKRLPLARAAVELLGREGFDVVLHELSGVPHRVVPQWLNASDVLLLTSAHEGSPNIVKEALSCNIPVVSVDVGDVSERVSDVAGCHIAAPEPNALARGLREVSEGNRRVEGRQSVAGLSLEAVAEKLHHVYERARERYRSAPAGGRT